MKPGSSYPLKYYKTLAATNDEIFVSFLNHHSKQDVKPGEVLNIIAGFPASVLIHAEFESIPCLQISAVVDSHFVTDEMLRTFAPVVTEILQNQSI